VAACGKAAEDVLAFFVGDVGEASVFDGDGDVRL
jgi:hypothetical protein